MEGFEEGFEDKFKKWENEFYSLDEKNRDAIFIRDEDKDLERYFLFNRVATKDRGIFEKLVKFYKSRIYSYHDKYEQNTLLSKSYRKYGGNLLKLRMYGYYVKIVNEYYTDSDRYSKEEFILKEIDLSDLKSFIRGFENRIDYCEFEFNLSNIFDSNWNCEHYKLYDNSLNQALNLKNKNLIKLKFDLGDYFRYTRQVEPETAYYLLFKWLNYILTNIKTCNLFCFDISWSTYFVVFFRNTHGEFNIDKNSATYKEILKTYTKLKNTGNYIQFSDYGCTITAEDSEEQFFEKLIYMFKNGTRGYRP